MFSTYEKVDGRERLDIENDIVTIVEGKGNVIIKFTFGKEITFLDVRHIPKIRKNLMSEPMLSKKGFKLVFKSDKFVLTKSGIYVGKCYLSEGLFKINCIPKIIINENVIASSYIVESYNVWHARLGHVNFNSMHKTDELRIVT